MSSVSSSLNGCRHLSVGFHSSQIKLITIDSLRPVLTSCSHPLSTLFSAGLHCETHVNNALYALCCVLLTCPPPPCPWNCSSATVDPLVAISDGHCSFLIEADFSAALGTVYSSLPGRFSCLSSRIIDWCGRPELTWCLFLSPSPDYASSPDLEIGAWRLSSSLHLCFLFRNPPSTWSPSLVALIRICVLTAPSFVFPTESGLSYVFVTAFSLVSGFILQKRTRRIS